MSCCRQCTTGKLAPVLLSLLLQACATTAGVLGLGVEKPEEQVSEQTAECAPDSSGKPLARWSSLSGSLLTRPGRIPAGGQESRRRIELVTPVAVAAIANTLYIADSGQRAIIRFDRGTQTASVFADVQGMTSRTDLYVDRANTLYLADPAAATITAFDIDGNLLQTFEDIAELPQPVAVAASPAGDEIFAADELASHILVFNRGGTVTRVIGAGTSTDVYFQSVTAIASGPDQLFVSDRLGHQVHALAPDGAYRYAFGKDDLVAPGALAIDTHSRVYVADNGDSTIKVFRGGQLEAVVGAPGDTVGLGFQVISSLWESDGLLFVADAGRASVDILRVVPPCH